MAKPTKKTILLVEDDLPTVEVYRTALCGAGFNIEIVNWGREAIKRIKEGPKNPDLVLLDLILPDINGLGVLEEVRKTENGKKLPVFILTNYTDEELVKMGYKLEAEKFLTKTDYPPSKLIKIINEKLK